jgi:uncharacterized protein (TIGR02996 family)
MPEYVRHTKSPAWGVGVLVREAYDQRTYLFADGIARTFKTAIAAKLIEPADEPDADDRQRLELGLGAITAAPDARAGVTATPKAIHLGLEAEIRAARDEVDPHLVYADWLLGKGDPRGELIVAHHQLAQAPGDKRRQLAAAKVLAAHADYFMPAGLADARNCELSWHLGYLDRVRLARRSNRVAELEPVLVELLAHPSARFIRHLVLGPLGDHTAFNYAPLVAAIADAAPPLLAELGVGDFTPRDTTLSFTRIGNATPLVKALPALRRLVLRGGVLSFSAALRHDRLEELAIETTDARALFVKLANGRVPALRSLSIAAPDLDPTATELAHLLSGQHAPSLRRLALRDTVHTARLLDAILLAPQFAKLESLALTGGDLGDAAVPGLVARAATWRHVELDLGGNRLGPVAGRHLASAGNVRVAAAAEPAAQTADAASDEARILALAPDARVAGNAREVAESTNWLELGRDRERVWGRFADATDFWVSAHLVTRETTCTCSSRRPCKHGLGLLVLAARRPLPERALPNAFRVRQPTARRFRPTRE